MQNANAQNANANAQNANAQNANAQNANANANKQAILHKKIFTTMNFDYACCDVTVYVPLSFFLSCQTEVQKAERRLESHAKLLGTKLAWFEGDGPEGELTDDNARVYLKRRDMVSRYMQERTERKNRKNRNKQTKKQTNIG